MSARVQKQVVTFSAEQVIAVGELSEGQELLVEQTWTKTGGTHLYVRRPDGREWHVARNGNPIELNVATVKPAKAPA